MSASARGFVAIAGAKVWFVVTGYAVHFALPRIFGSVEAFGRYSTAMSFASILNNVLIATTILTVSRFISTRSDPPGQTLRKGLWFQSVLGAVLAVAVLTLADPLAQTVFRDASVAPLLRWVSWVVFAYALYAALVGSLNGQQRFGFQAGLDASFSTIRAALIIGGAAFFGSMLGESGPSESGAMLGFAAAASTILLVALAAVGTGSRGSQLSTREWLAFLLPVASYQLFLNGILLSDVLVLKGTVADMAATSGQSDEAAASAASTYVGYYSAAQKFALVPYQLLLSMTFVVFPAISRATKTDDRAAATNYLRSAIRASLILVVAVAAPIAGAAQGLMNLAFPPEYVAGAPALEILVLGAAGFALFVITAAVHSGAGRPMVAAQVAGVGLVAVVFLNVSFVQYVGLGPDIPVAAATATTTAMLLALALSAARIYRHYGSVFRFAQVGRTAVAGVVGYAAAHAVPADPAIAAAPALVVGTLAYLATLFLLRELRRDDLSVVIGLLRKRRTEGAS